ncbi:MAG: hypothetical protein A3J67_00420 [Parcubacteria group bacterium RIFCSPHIGHO2_02_FULL_48_10b]|uniref:Sugar O-methyltransferase n=1 Tax=Candidatus Wolfebacteria bacterium RIFCSPLOWO2_01_FULL_47_17b TaxID=1802558 RepID=A0A1F8DYV8_9BACT|nr:MAG: hypothetical protein A2935_01555 [Candidatus Wolfebacteria bacterium RIFCSPLOWO2_01_FULL_47_17b]OHB21842.1 MAG: hypothetical protein A3J67_00420 [Parcubacteria group bacterium RIFCSPHIGHO2_02_FULL_48_10b]
MDTHSVFASRVERARKSREYQNYLQVRDAVFKMMSYMPDGGEAIPSAYWREELSGMEYMLDASPLIIEKLRHHCYHLTGVREYDYRPHHAHRSPALERQFRMLRSLDSKGLFVPEPPELGGFGYNIDGKLINTDTLLFYRSLLVLDKAGLLDQFRDDQQRKIILEIGGGWCGFAYQMKTLFPNLTYIVVDLPGSILFGATYIKTLFPNARVLTVADNFGLPPQETVSGYDFIFIPHHLWPALNFGRPDLTVNMASFQEMTTAQVESYAKKIHSWGCSALYSINRDHSPNNPELTTVSSILGRYYDLTEMRLPTPKEKPTTRERIVKIVKFILGKRSGVPSIHEYRHLVGKPK